MEFKVKLLSFSEPASDGSRVSRSVVEQYLSSDLYKNEIASRKMLGTLTHRARNVVNGVKNLNPNVKGTIGKDDLMLELGEASPTHYITKLECGNDDWLYAYAKILDTEDLDSEAVERIKRLRGMLKNGCLIGVSAVILGFWQSEKGSGGDVLKKLVQLKSFDCTLCPSWKSAQVVSVTDDNGDIINTVDTHTTSDKYFSESTEETDVLKAKTFSNVDDFMTDGLVKSSKIDGQFTTLMAKQFSGVFKLSNLIDEGAKKFLSEIGETEEKTFGEISVVEEEAKEKDFSVATIKERVRYAKFSPRMRFRKLFLEYKMFVRQNKGMDPETEKILRSLFMSDVLDIFKSITGDIIAGKQINTLIGASSLGKNVRVAAQQLQMPCRMAFTEMSKKGTLTPMRMKKLQEAYTEFAHAMCDEVFGSNPVPEELLKEEEANNE